jgi:hypothetical protein
MRLLSLLRQLYTERPTEITLVLIAAAVLGFWWGYTVAAPFLVK